MHCGIPFRESKQAQLPMPILNHECIVGFALIDCVKLSVGRDKTSNFAKVGAE
jgi:hypothetical protein